MKVQYIGRHQPNRIEDVSESRGKLLIQSGEYKLVDEAIIIKNGNSKRSNK